MKKMTIYFLIGMSVFVSTSCSYLTARGRQEAAYARYVRHYSAGRVKMQRKLAGSPKLPASQPLSEPKMATETGPESVTADSQ